MAALAALALLAAASAAAQGGATEARALLDAGRFEQAYRAGVDDGTPSGLVLAAEAASDQAVYVLDEHDAQIAWLRRAQGAAGRAVDGDGSLAAAYVQLARAKGEIAKRTGILQNLGTAGELKDLFEHALSIRADDADALMGLALWHLELTQRGVGWMYGASAERVLPLLERSIAAAPDRINLRVEYARALRRLGQEPAAEAQLRKALALPVETAVDGYEHGKAASMRDSAP